MASHDSSGISFSPDSPRINLGLDIGHSSIGWAVVTNDPTIPKILGCGVTTFGESCQNSARAGFRRMRRNIAARRNRVKHLAKFIAALDVLSPGQLKTVPTSAPWRDAARVLAGIETLDWARLWNVIRWYAHNRGYDGNAEWSRQAVTDDTEGDTEKERQAKSLMEKHGTSSMAATVCAALNIDPAGEKTASNIYFKGYNAAFPRTVVKNEVRAILEAHRGKLPGLDEAFISCLMDESSAHPAAPRLAKRHKGGLLFGQMIPRFDNRIIPGCQVSEKPINTPNKHSKAFYAFRWAQLLGNIRVQTLDGESRVLTAEERAAIDEKMKAVGRMTGVPFKAAIQEATRCIAPKLDSLFMTEEMENALMLDPVRFGLLKNPVWEVIWKAASEPHRRVLENKLFKRRRLTPEGWFAWLKSAPRNLDTTELEQRCELAAHSTDKPKRGKASKKEVPAPVEDWRTTEFKLSGKSDEIPSGRARYATDILRKAAAAYMRGEDPRASGGVLFSDPSNPDDPQQKRLLQRALNDTTNNHLVRQRLLVLERLVERLVNEFADGDKSRVGLVAIEVVRDLQEFSGLNAKETQKLLSLKLKHHKSCAAALAAAFKTLGLEDATTASLIRKFRVADDLGWTCPYTLQKYSAADILRQDSELQIEHIIPRSLRPSDSLDSVVLTFAAVNKLKGRRTALEFVKEFGGTQVPEKPNLSIVSEAKFKEFVDSLRPSKNSAKSTGTERKTDDEKRVRRRRALLLTEHYDKRDADFTGRDLTQTSHLVKLASRRLLAAGFAWNQVKHVPGSVTVAVRKGWPEMFGQLEAVAPATRNKTKDEIRGITHLHHAVDAATLAFALTRFPESTWKAMARRKLPKEERAELAPVAKVNHDDGAWMLHPLPEKSLLSLRDALARRRVTQHLPKSYRGLRVELNPWRVVRELDNGKVELTQNARVTEIVDGVPLTSLTTKTDAVKPSKLLGFREKSHHGKLGANKSALVIGDNYGVALDPEPVVLPHFKVYPALRAIAQRNGGKWPRVLRNGMIIEVPNGRYQGCWRICSVKDNTSGLAIDMAQPDETKASKINVLLSTLTRDGLKLL